LVVNNVSISPTEENIPDEDNQKVASSYILPPKQYIRSISVKNEQKRGREKGTSWGPKLKFDNKIEHKSRSRSKMAFDTLPPSGRKGYSKWSHTTLKKGLTFAMNEFHKPKIWSNYSSTIREKIDTLKYNSTIQEDSSYVNFGKAKKSYRKAAYNSLVESTLKIKKIASTIKKKIDNRKALEIISNSKNESFLKNTEQDTRFTSNTSSCINISHGPQSYNRHKILNSNNKSKKKVLRDNNLSGYKAHEKIRVLKSKNKNSELQLGTTKLKNQTSRNNLSIVPKNWEGFITSIHGGGSFIKYLAQSEK